MDESPTTPREEAEKNKEGSLQFAAKALARMEEIKDVIYGEDSDKKAAYLKNTEKFNEAITGAMGSEEVQTLIKDIDVKTLEDFADSLESSPNLLRSIDVLERVINFSKLKKFLKTDLRDKKLGDVIPELADTSVGEAGGDKRIVEELREYASDGDKTDSKINNSMVDVVSALNMWGGGELLIGAADVRKLLGTKITELSRIDGTDRPSYHENQLLEHEAVA